MNILKTLTTALLLTSAVSVSAFELRNDIALSGGWRSDKWEWNGDYDLVLPGGAPTENTISNKTKRLNIWEVGVKGRLVMPQLDCFCDYGFLDNFYLKGHAYWGWATGNKGFSEDINNPISGASIESSTSLKSGRTYDYAIGLGYLFDLGCEWGLGITGGYAWDKQKLKTKPGDTTFFAADGTVTAVIDPDDYFDGTSWNSRWQGPWVGADLFYSWCDWVFNLGYEYHFAHYRGTTSFTDVGLLNDGADRTYRSNHAHGNVVYLDATYQFCDGWELGASFRWNGYRATKGSFTVDDPSFVSSNGINNKWNSYGFNLNLGYAF